MNVYGGEGDTARTLDSNPATDPKIADKQGEPRPRITKIRWPVMILARHLTTLVLDIESER
jgi:hypothetical protein